MKGDFSVLRSPDHSALSQLAASDDELAAALDVPNAPRRGPSAGQLQLAAVGMILFVVYGSLLPFNYTSYTLAEAWYAFRGIAFFDSTDLVERGDWIISTVMYMVMSFLLTGAVCVDRPRRLGFLAAILVVLACFGLSVAIEFLQVYFPPRTVSLNDVVWESLGGIAGALAWVVFGQPLISWVRGFGNVTSVPGLAARFLLGYLGVLVVVQLMPFDFVVATGELATKFHEGKIRLMPFSGSESLGSTAAKVGLNLACYFPLGFLLALARRRGIGAAHRRAILGLALAGPAIIEFLQIFTYSRTSDVTDVLTGVLGVYIGWRCGGAYRSARRTNPQLHVWPAASLRIVCLTLILAWFCVVIYLFWGPWPISFSTDAMQFASESHHDCMIGFRRLSIAPFADYYWGSKYNLLDQFVRKALSFIPLGVLAGIMVKDPFRRSASAIVLATALGFATFLEAGRYFMPDRVPSTTDILIMTVGAWLGFLLTRRIRGALWADAALFGWERVSGKSKVVI